ncbi:CPBP family intramembrane metalloprotease [Massilia sp. P8910]|uniref:CPBP family intramembrane glutamic endopeptidase n=1 Tax=Massilia antarctica TaxID=2765360 RepID=UPI001E3A6F88|nr:MULTISPECIES: type II CAAX endopeptidase family protein [Massilia]MCE3605484.1 CPBP family intramembrane metalloprotease [Massilia antarctica]MCY0915795.1 type II CAAX endopeptidase family protein [Massilia sp. H27-R4]
MNAPEPRKTYPATFFFLVIAISAPMWILGSFLDESPLPDNIPLTDIGATLSPAIAACILIYVENGRQGLLAFVRRLFDHHRIKKRGALVLILLVMPALYVITYAALRIAGIPVSAHVELSASLLIAFVMFSTGAAMEEIGYSAYATDALQKRFSPRATALVIGVPWALWHLPSMMKMGQSPQLIVWGLLGTIAFRVITVWLYNNAGCSLFAVILAHAVGTTARSAFPGGRHGYEVADGSISYAVIMIAALCVAFFSGRARHVTHAFISQ